MELVKGRSYRAKRPANSRGLVNDRQIVHMTATHVQYDGAAVRIGHRLPTVTRAEFLAWAGSDVTDVLPQYEWQSWDEFRASKPAPGGKPV